MPVGRPPKPTVLKLLQGTARHDRLNPSEPEPPALVDARPPSWLDSRGRRAWRDWLPVLTGMRVLTEADGAALALMCDAYAEYLAARAVLRREGASYTTGELPAQMVRQRPEVAQAADAWRRVSAMMQQFGLTPASRSRVSSQQAETVDPVQEWLHGGRAAR